MLSNILSSVYFLRCFVDLSWVIAGCSFVDQKIKMNWRQLSRLLLLLLSLFQLLSIVDESYSLQMIRSLHHSWLWKWRCLYISPWFFIVVGWGGHLHKYPWSKPSHNFGKWNVVFVYCYTILNSNTVEIFLLKFVSNKYIRI